MTFNVGNGLARPEQLAEVLCTSGADVIALQEVAPRQAEVLTSDVKEIYPHQVVWPLGFAGKALLSRFPVLSQQQLELYPDRPDLQVALEVEGQPLQVLVAHPPPPRLQRGRVRFDTHAMLQLEALGALALAHRPGVMMGDFNMTPRNPTHARFRESGLVDAFGAAGSGRGWTLPRRVGQTPRFQHGLHRLALRPLARVDYIWCTPEVQVQAAWVGEDGGSDHLPVFARIVVSQR
jgi:vancomycin resistance protein VanJ